MDRKASPASAGEAHRRRSVGSGPVLAALGLAAVVVALWLALLGWAGVRIAVAALRSM